MKKLLILIPKMGGGGAERVVSIIANNLCDEYDVQITTLVSKESFYYIHSKVKRTSAEYKINRKNKITRIISMGKNFVNAIFYVRSAIKEFKPDIVFSVLEEMDIVSYLASYKLEGFARVYSERNDPKERNKYLQKILEYIYNKGDKLVCQTETIANEYLKVGKKQKIVIPNPVDFADYPKKVDESSEKYIVGVGRLREQKNFMLLIDSFALIASKYPKLKLVIYGEGPQREKLQKRIYDLKLEKRIVLRGTSKQILCDIRDATIYVMSSNYEGFPNALIEAIAMGLPVISTDFASGVAREIITDDVGKLVPCKDKIAMGNAMDDLLKNVENRMYIRKNGYKTIMQFDKNLVIQEWKKMFDNIRKNM